MGFLLNSGSDTDDVISYNIITSEPTSRLGNQEVMVDDDLNPLTCSSARKPPPVDHRDKCFRAPISLIMVWFCYCCLVSLLQGSRNESRITQSHSLW